MEVSGELDGCICWTVVSGMGLGSVRGLWGDGVDFLKVLV